MKLYQMEIVRKVQNLLHIFSMLNGVSRYMRTSRFVWKESCAAVRDNRMWCTSEVQSRTSPAGLPVYSHEIAAAARTAATTTRTPVDVARRSDAR